jgi:hypothetical protein
MVLKKNPNPNQKYPVKSDANLLTMSADDAKVELRELIEKYSKFDRDSILRFKRNYT